jgi:hypothetical protein
MPLSFRDPSAPSGDYAPYITWKPMAGEWQDRDGAVALGAPVVFDLPSLQTGWRTFEGGVPQWQADPSISQPADKPGDGWERGFKVNMFSAKNFGDEAPIREWCDTSRTAQKAIETLYNTWEQMGETEKLPVVQFGGQMAVTMGMKTFKAPMLEIKKLIDRPAELAKDEASGSENSPSNVSQPETADDDEFI